MIFTFIMCIIPINALYSITLWNDILFSYLLMFLCFLAYVIVDRKGKVDYGFMILLSVVMAFVVHLRGNGFYVVAVFLVLYAAYLFLKDNRKMSVMLLTLTAALILVIASLNVVYEVEDNEKDVVMTKVDHMLAYYDFNVEMESSDRDKVHEIFNPAKNNGAFNPKDSDITLAISDCHKMKSDRGTYIDLAIKYSRGGPLQCLKYLFSSYPMVWRLVRGSSWKGHPYYMTGETNRLQLDFERYCLKQNFTPHEPYENLSYANYGTLVFAALNLLSLGVQGFAPTDTVFKSPALYMHLSIIVPVLLHFITKSREIYLMYLPNLLNILIIFASMTVQDNRYLYANLLVFYLLFMILLHFRQRSIDLSDISPRNPVRYLFNLLFR